MNYLFRLEKVQSEKEEMETENIILSEYILKMMKDSDTFHPLDI